MRGKKMAALAAFLAIGWACWAGPLERGTQAQEPGAPGYARTLPPDIPPKSGEPPQALPEMIWEPFEPPQALPLAWPARMPPWQPSMCPALAALLGTLPNVDIVLLRARELGLSDRQVEDLTDLRLEAGLKIVALNAAREQDCLKLDAALSRDKVDLDAVRALLHAIADAESEICYLDIRTSTKTKQLLSAEQLARLGQAPAAPGWQVVPPVPPPATSPAQ